MYQASAFVLQARAPLPLLRLLLRGVLAPRVLDPPGLLRRRDRPRSFFHRTLPRPKDGLRRRQLGASTLGTLSRTGNSAACHGELFRGLVLGGGDRLLLAMALFDARTYRRDALLGPLAVVAYEGEFLFDAGDLGVGLVQLALCRVQRVARCVVLAAKLLRAPFRVAQSRGLCLELDRHALELALQTRALVADFLLLDVPEQLPGASELGLQRLIALRGLGLCGQVLELGAELAADIFDAVQVAAGVRKPELGLAAALAILRHTRRFLEKDADLLRLGLDNARDGALLDDGVRAPAQTGAEEDVGDIASPHVLIVDVVGRVAIALEHALDDDFAVLRPRAACLAEAVVEMHLDAGAARRLALAGAVEDDVLHGLAAQMPRRGFAQHPAHRVDDVRLAAAIWTHHADDLTRQRHVGGIHERLEAR